MKTDYDKFDAAVRNIAASVLIYDGKPAGRIIWKYGAATTCYFQLWGAPMHHGRASGYGYDKRGASAAKAILSLLDSGDLDRAGVAPSLADLDGLTLRDVSNGAGWETLRADLERIGFVLACAI